MTLDEFYEKYKQPLNLAAAIPLDIVKALGESFGIEMKAGEMHDDYLQRVADYLESIKNHVSPQTS